MHVLKRIFCSLLLVLLAIGLEAQQLDTSYFTNLKFRDLGPSRGGRSTAVVGDLNNPNLFYMGSTGGGVWKTDNGGQSWKNISDGYFGGSIGSIAIAPSDDNIIYVGQGEESLRGNVSFGYGVWKSDDAGISWKSVGLKNGRHIPRIAVHPKEANTVFAAVLGDLYVNSTERGLYKSVDGGESWKRVLYNGDSAGCNEVIIDPLNHRVMYASTWQVRRSPYSFSSGGKGSGLWRSKDGGETWENLMSKPGIPEGIVGKITISASPVQKRLVFAMIEHATQGGLYRSEDGGESWERVNGEGKIRQRAWYFSRVYCDTKDANKVYTMNVYFQKSMDGGKTFKAINTPHVDHHDLWIDPNNNQRMITGNDGGGQVSMNGGNTWSTYHNQPTEQFYRVSTDNHVPYRIYGAQQDNSTMRVNHITGSYEVTAGGESAHLAVDPNNDDIVFAGSYGGYLTMKNHETGDNRAINVWPDNPMGYGAEGMKYRFQWNFPLFFSPHDDKKLYAASNHLHVSYDYGNSWSIISPDLTRNDSSRLVSSGGPITQDNTGVEYYCTIFAAVESQKEANVIWVGSDDGLAHITRDGGKTWKNITPKKLPKWTMINSIEEDPFNKGCAWIVATSYKNGDYKPYIYYLTDYGSKAEIQVSGIADEHFVRALQADPIREGLLFAGTERGLYISYDNGEHWHAWQLNLPIVPITDMTIKENDLIIATQGRGFWIIDQLDAVRSMNQKELRENVTILGAEGANLVGRDKATLVYHLADSLSQKDTLFIDLIDPDGRVARTYSNIKFSADTLTINPLKGVNYFDWNMRYAGAKRPDGMILWWASTAGPRAKPGKYYFRIHFKDRTQKEEFQIDINPNSEATEEDYIEKFDFLYESVLLLDSTHEAIESMKTLQGSLNQFMGDRKFKKDDDIKVLGDSLVRELSDIINMLYQTKNRSNQDPINFPIKLNNKLAHLNALVSMGNFGPTEQAIAVKRELEVQIREQLDRYHELQTVKLQSFNDLLLNRKINLIEVK